MTLRDLDQFFCNGGSPETGEPAAAPARLSEPTSAPSGGPHHRAFAEDNSAAAPVEDSIRLRESPSVSVPQRPQPTPEVGHSVSEPPPIMAKAVEPRMVPGVSEQPVLTDSSLVEQVLPAVPNALSGHSVRSESVEQIEDQPVATPQPPSAPAGELPMRLRLDRNGEKLKRRKRFSPFRWVWSIISAPYRHFYRQCPNCRADEVYAVRLSGQFVKGSMQRGWVVQKMYCERCTGFYYRPGMLFLAPPAPIRPRDLYD